MGSVHDSGAKESDQPELNEVEAAKDSMHVNYGRVELSDNTKKPQDLFRMLKKSAISVPWAVRRAVSSSPDNGDRDLLGSFEHFVGKDGGHAYVHTSLSKSSGHRGGVVPMAVPSGLDDEGTQRLGHHSSFGQY